MTRRVASRGATKVASCLRPQCNTRAVILSRPRVTPRRDPQNSFKVQKDVRPKLTVSRAVPLSLNSHLVVYNFSILIVVARCVGAHFRLCALRV